MKLYDIDNIRRDEKQDNLYNLFESTFSTQGGIQQSNLVVGREEVMRIDLICNRIYKSIDEVDFLCNLNDIDNALNIMENDTIYYTGYGAIDSYRVDEPSKIETRNSLINPNKSTKKDNNRQKFLEDGFALPPTFKPIPKPSVRVDGNNIVIG